MYGTLERILLPIRPVWVRAACLLPDWIASRRLAAENEETGARKKLDGLKEAMAALDSTTGSILFALLEEFRLDTHAVQRTAELRKAALHAAEDAARALSGCGFPAEPGSGFP
jgi:hypothetical protein